MKKHLDRVLTAGYHVSMCTLEFIIILGYKCPASWVSLFPSGSNVHITQGRGFSLLGVNHGQL